MPEDPEKAKERKRRWFNKKYAQDETFRVCESIRKSEWLETPEGKESNRAASDRYYYEVKRPVAASRR